MADSDRKTALMILEICETVGMEFDFNKGLDNFFIEAARHTDTDILKRMAKQPEINNLDDLCMVIENELKTRGEI